MNALHPCGVHLGTTGHQANASRDDGDGPEAIPRVDGWAAQRSVLDALRAAYPALRGAIRDDGTLR